MRALLLPTLVALCSAFALPGCGDQAGPAGPLMFEADGRTVAFPDDTETFVWCGPITPRDKREAVHVVVSPAGERFLPLWEFHALTKRVKPGAKIAFGGDSPAAELFIAAGETEAISGELPGSKGTLTIKKIDCDGNLEFSAEGKLANEFGFEVMEVHGTFTGKVGDKVAPAFNG
jgi:hypothetical protein